MIYRQGTEADYPACEALLPDDDYAEAWEFPTLVAEREGQILGVLSTRTTDGLVSIGRLALAPGRQAPWVALRLVEAYERQLSTYGLTAYWWGVERRRQDLQQLMGRLGFVPQLETADAWWYRKELPA